MLATKFWFKDTNGFKKKNKKTYDFKTALNTFIFKVHPSESAPR